MKRKICWPNPDATCLEGGCGYCEEGIFKTKTQLIQYIEKVPRVQNRGNDDWINSKDALYYGLIYNRNNMWKGKRNLPKIKIEISFCHEIEYTEEAYMTHDGPMSIEAAVEYEKHKLNEDPMEVIDAIWDTIDDVDNDAEVFQVKVWSE